jgi:hypothetical protein
LLTADAEQHLQGSLERDIAEIGQPDATLRSSDQVLGAWRPAQAGQRVKHRVGERGDCLVCNRLDACRPQTAKVDLPRMPVTFGKQAGT